MIIWKTQNIKDFTTEQGELNNHLTFNKKSFILLLFPCLEKLGGGTVTFTGQPNKKTEIKLGFFIISIFLSFV